MKVLTIVTLVLDSEDTLPDLLNSASFLSKLPAHSFSWHFQDGGSTDSSLTLISEFIHQNPLFDIKVVSMPDKGLYDGLNNALQNINSYYYLVVNSDDQFSCTPSEYLDLYLICSKLSYDCISLPFYTHDNIICDVSPLPFLFSGVRNKIAGHSCSSVIKRSCHDALGLYDTQYSIASDVKFLLSIILSSGQIARHNTPLCRFGLGGVSSTNKSIALYESFLVYLKSFQFIYAFIIVLKLMFFSLRTAPALLRPLLLKR